MSDHAISRRASDVLFNEIFSSRNSIRRENIKILKSVCDQMEKDRVVITAAEASRRGGENGPAYSTISNKGSRLGEYIRLRINEQAASWPPSKPNPNEHNLSDTISDPVLSAQIRDKESTARWLKKENSALRHLFKSLSPGIDIDSALTHATRDRSFTLLLGESSRKPPADRSLNGVMLKLMDHLIRERQYIELRGRLTINHKAVLNPEEMEIYRHASGLTEEEWKLRYGG